MKTSRMGELLIIIALALTGCSKGDGPQEIEIADGVDGRDGKSGKDSTVRGPRGPASTERGPAGPRGPSGVGSRGPRGDVGEPGSGSRGDRGDDGNDAEPCRYEPRDYGYDFICPDQDPVPVYHGNDGDRGDSGRDGDGMDVVYSYSCTGGFSEDGWHWNLRYRITKYSTGHYWLALEQSGASTDREGIMWDEQTELTVALFSARWNEARRTVTFRHRPSGIIWDKSCERIDE